MLSLVLFLVCLAATGLGAVGGFGGGVIIKPVVDAMGVLPVSTVSFLSTCTVLCMSVVSVARSRGRGAPLELRQAVPLAVGAALGGIAGKLMFDWVQLRFSNEAVLGLAQAIVLIVLTAAVMVSVLRRGKSRTFQIRNLAGTAAIGLVLGAISSFIGIGGGPFNVAALLLFFSMDAKTAAKNSIFIVLLCQAANLALTLLRGTVPAFSWAHLAVMALGGVGGALIGAAVSKRVGPRAVEILVIGLMAFVIVTNVYNVAVFLPQV